MKLLSQEHYQLIAQFERSHSGRFDKEEKSIWPKGIIYQDGRINEMFLAYREGYAFCEADMRSDLQNLEASRDGYRADAERNAKDAERYRWLRSQPNDTQAPRVDVVHWVEEGDVNTGSGLRLEELDDAIDAAIAAQQGEGEKE